MRKLWVTLQELSTWRMKEEEPLIPGQTLVVSDEGHRGTSGGHSKRGF